MNLFRRIFSPHAANDTATLDPLEAARLYNQLTADAKAECSRWLREHQPGREEGGKQRALSTVTGTLLFEFDGPIGPQPFHHARVELWDRDLGAAADLLGSADSGLDGSFTVPYDAECAGTGDAPDLELRILVPHAHFRPDGTTLDVWECIQKVRGPDDVTGDVDFGEIRVAYWEYDTTSPIPRLRTQEHGSLPEQYPAARSLAMLKAVAPIELTKRSHLQHLADGGKLSVEEIQDAYPDTMTRTVERSNPGHTRTGLWLGERLLRGMYCTPLDRDGDTPEDPSRLRIYHAWNAYEQDGVHCLPEMDLRLSLRDEALHPTSVRLGFRTPGQKEPRSPLRWEQFSPGDGARWDHALRHVRTSLSYDAALGNHLGQCHLNVEQYALAARRNLRRSPLRALLAPHLREVVLVNHSADSFLIGPTGYITRAGALTDRGIRQRLVHLMGSYDWKGYQPPTPLCPGHHFAHAARLAWDLCEHHCRRFLTEQRAALESTWAEVHRFSNDLLSHSVPRFACSHLRRTAVQGSAPWLSPNERPDYRSLAGGASVPALSAVTHSDVPASGEFEHIVQLATYVIHFATFRHAWANNLQWDDAGEVLYANLGLRYGDGTGLGPESDAEIAPTAEHASEMLWISWMLSRTASGLLLDNDDDDIDPRFVAEVRARRPSFEAWGLRVDRLGARINI